MIFKVSFGTSDMIRFYGSSTRTEQRVGSLSPRSRVRHVLLGVSLLNPPFGSHASLALVGRGPSRSPCTSLFPRPAVRGSARGRHGLWLQRGWAQSFPIMAGSSLALRLLPPRASVILPLLTFQATSLCASPWHVMFRIQGWALVLHQIQNSLFFIWLVYSILHFLFLKLLSFFVVFYFPPS